MVKVDESKYKFILQEHNFKGKTVDRLYAKIDYKEPFHKDAKDKIWPAELADECIKTYWKNAKLSTDYKITTYIA